MYRFRFYALLYILIQWAGLAQAQSRDSVLMHDLEPFTISAFRAQSMRKSSINISVLNTDSLGKYVHYNLSDMLTQVPGVSMLSTGVAISKPVIRGLYGNRITVLLSGLKFDNQQWQEEHGLGLSDMGLYSVELIKGPLSVLYGSEAIGGVINLIEERAPEKNTSTTDVGIRFNQNTRGGLLQGGYKISKKNHWWKLRMGIENNADYSDGHNQRVLNSRFDGYYLKSTWGFEKKKWNSTNNLLSSFNRYGFIFNDVYTFVKPDARWSTALDKNPTHLVLLNILSSENKFVLRNQSLLYCNIGFQSNKRMENEGGGAISLNMHLLTGQYLLKWERSLDHRRKVTIAQLTSFENNSNYGARKIVPDALMQEANLSAYIEDKVNTHWLWEHGIGIGEKWIVTRLTPSVNTNDKLIHPFQKFAPYYNVYSGFNFRPNQHWLWKLNIATGVRIANLAELSSNGLHEGVFTYEIGNPNMKNEQNLSLNSVVQYARPSWSLTLSPFVNYFRNYIYLAPTNELWYGFPVYRYLQQDAQQYGTECSFNYQFDTHWQTTLSYAGMSSKTADGQYTPYIPAQKLSPSFQYTMHLSQQKSSIKVFSKIDYYAAQHQSARYEIQTGDYWLWEAGVQAQIQSRGKSYTLGLNGNNLLNVAYYDHMSRFKYFGLLNMGRNICLQLAMKW